MNLTLEKINQQYEQLCIQVGDTVYKIKQHNELLTSLYNQIDELNKLAATLNKVTGEKSE